MNKSIWVICALILFASPVFAEDWSSIGEPDCLPTTECVYINSAVGGGSGTSWSDALTTWAPCLAVIPLVMNLMETYL